jgi:hypothetical protein
LNSDADPGLRESSIRPHGRRKKANIGHAWTDNTGMEAIIRAIIRG